MKMRIHVETVLPCLPCVAWEMVLQSDLLKEVSRPMIRFSADGDQSLPKTCQQGSTVRIRCWLFGLIPLPTRTLFFERVDGEAFQIQTREHDRLIRHWDHLISIRETDRGRVLYSDTIEIEAGWLTFLVWLFAQWFYRHRQRRWQRVVRRLACPTA